MKQPDFQNSAGRLLALLASMPSGRALLEVLPPLVGVTSKNSHERQQAALRFLMELHKVYLEFCDDMLNARISDQQREMMLNGLESLRETLYPFDLNGGLRPPTEAEISLLKVCATFIDQESPITEDDIECIRRSITELRPQVDDSTISPTLRKALLELIRLSEDAIARFTIHGARGLRRAFKEMLADAAELYGMADSATERSELTSSTTWAVIVKHLRTFDAVASKLLNYQKILEGASQLLIGGPPMP